MSEHEEYMPIYNDPMYWSYLNRDKDKNKNTTTATNPETKKPIDDNKTNTNNKTS